MTDIESKILEGAGKEVGKEIVQEGKNVLQPAVSLLDPPAKEAGKLFGNLVGLVGDPVQIARECWAKFLERSICKVPEEQRVEPPLKLLASVVDAVQYQDSDTLIYDMFTELLANACNREHQADVHPGFVDMLKHMAPDEALILKMLRDGNELIYQGQWVHPSYEEGDELEIYQPTEGRRVKKPIAPLYPKSDGYMHRGQWLGFNGIPQTNIQAYYESLSTRCGLLQKMFRAERDEVWIVSGASASSRNVMILSSNYHIRLSALGKQFVDTCVPEDP